MFGVRFVEPLEGRRHLSTSRFNFSFDSDNGFSADGNVTATIDRHGDSATISVNGLPAHKMLRTRHIG